MLLTPRHQFSRRFQFSSRMKFKSSLFFVLLLFFLNPICRGADTTVKEEEYKMNKTTNEERINECGKNKLPIEETGWTQENYGPLAVLTSNKHKAHEHFKTLGVYISKHHIMTSAQMLLYSKNGTPVWIFDDKNLTIPPACSDASDRSLAYVKVPEEYLKDIFVQYGNCDTKMICDNFIVTKSLKAAFLFNMCSGLTNFVDRNALLVLALENTFAHMRYPCVGIDEDVAVNDQVDIYGLSDVNIIKEPLSGGYTEERVLRHRSANVTKVKENGTFLFIENYYSHHDGGAPLIRTGKDTNSHLVGVSALDGYFYEVSHYKEALCETVGICPPQKSTLAPSTTDKPSSTAYPISTTVSQNTVTVKRTPTPIDYYYPNDEQLPPVMTKDEMAEREREAKKLKQKEEAEAANDFDYLDDLSISGSHLKGMEAIALVFFVCWVL